MVYGNRLLTKDEINSFIGDLVKKNFRNANTEITHKVIIIGSNEEGSFDKIELDFIFHDNDGCIRYYYYANFAVDGSTLRILKTIGTNKKEEIYIIRRVADCIRDGIIMISKYYLRKNNEKSVNQLNELFFSAFYNVMKASNTIEKCY